MAPGLLLISDWISEYFKDVTVDFAALTGTVDYCSLSSPEEGTKAVFFGV